MRGSVLFSFLIGICVFARGQTAASADVSCAACSADNVLLQRRSHLSSVYSLTKAVDHNVIFGTTIDGLVSAKWGQRWALAMYAPKLRATEITDEGPNERLGCLSTALAQVMFFHRRCPTGFVQYEAPGFEPTGLDFDVEAQRGLCDWASFTDSPANSSSDLATEIVAKYLYAAALVVQRWWGEHHNKYMLKRKEQAAAISAHYNMGCENLVLREGDTAQLERARVMIVEAIDLHLPVIMLIRHFGHGSHEVVVDGHREFDGMFELRIIAGFNGFNDGWYDFRGPFCFGHYQNGSSAADGGCAYNYSHPRMLRFIRPTS